MVIVPWWFLYIFTKNSHFAKSHKQCVHKINIFVFIIIQIAFWAKYFSPFSTMYAYNFWGGAITLLLNEYFEISDFKLFLKEYKFQESIFFWYWLSQIIPEGYSTWWGVSAQKPRLVWLSRTSRNSSCNKKLFNFAAQTPLYSVVNPTLITIIYANLFIKRASFLVNFLELRFLEFQFPTLIPIIYANLFINSHTPPL